MKAEAPSIVLTSTAQILQKLNAIVDKKGSADIRIELHATTEIVATEIAATEIAATEIATAVIAIAKTRFERRT